MREAFLLYHRPSPCITGKKPFLLIGHPQFEKQETTDVADGADKALGPQIPQIHTD